jgi:hypothetical protein
MSGLQSIIDNSDSIDINRRRVVGVQLTRNEIVRTSETPTRNTWKFTVNQNNGFPYETSRAILEELDRLDRTIPQSVSFGSNPKMSWLFRYQGGMTLGNIGGITVSSFIGNQLVLNMPVGIAAGTNLFLPNDFIQIGSYHFPFTSTGTYTTANIVANKLTVTTHRPNFISNSVVNQPIVVGAGVQFKVVCTNMPTYRLVPGAFRRGSDGTVMNNARIEFEDSFEFVEYTG